MNNQVNKIFEGLQNIPNIVGNIAGIFVYLFRILLAILREFLFAYSEYCLQYCRNFCLPVGSTGVISVCYKLPLSSVFVFKILGSSEYENLLQELAD